MSQHSIADAFRIAFQKQWQATMDSLYAGNVSPFLLACFAITFGPLLGLIISELCLKRFYQRKVQAVDRTKPVTKNE